MSFNDRNKTFHPLLCGDLTVGGGGGSSDRIIVGFTRTYAISKVVSSNPAHGEVYSIQHYVINVVSDLRQVVLQLLPQNKTKRHDITEILLKAGLNTKTRTPNVRTDCAKNLATEPEKRFNNYENTIC